MNFFQPSFKLKEKRREGAKVIKRYHAPVTPYERALAHPRWSRPSRRGCASMYRSSIRCAAGRDARYTGGARRIASIVGGRSAARTPPTQAPRRDAAKFARALGKTVESRRGARHLIENVTADLTARTGAG